MGGKTENTGGMEETRRPFGGKNKGIGEWKSSRFITNIIVFILYLDYMFLKSLRLLGVNMPGLSNYMICKKSV